MRKSIPNTLRYVRDLYICFFLSKSAFLVYVCLSCLRLLHLYASIYLQQQLDMGIGENRHATHRNQRWYDLTERAYEYSQGPIMYHDIMTHERLDRPQVRVFQRHPGTQLKEPQEIVRVGLVFLFACDGWDFTSYTCNFTTVFLTFLRYFLIGW